MRRVFAADPEFRTRFAREVGTVRRVIYRKDLPYRKEFSSGVAPR